MGNIGIFAAAAAFWATAAALASLLAASLFAEAEGPSARVGRGLRWLGLGVAAEFAVTWIDFRLAGSTASVSLLVFLELSILLASLVCLVLAACDVVRFKTPRAAIVRYIVVGGFALIAVFTFVVPDGAMVYNLRAAFPILGFACVAGAFASRAFGRNPFGYLLAAATAGFAALVFIARLFVSIPWLLGWGVPAAVYLSLAAAAFLVRISLLQSARREGEEKLKAYDRRLAEIFKSSPFPIVISRLGGGELLLVNDNAAKLFGIGPGAADRYRFRDLFADDANRKDFDDSLKLKGEVQDFEILVKSPESGQSFWLLASASVVDFDRDIAIYTAFQDITGRKNREERLKDAASHDPLTGLFNRRYFEEVAASKIAFAKTNAEDFSVLMLDADHFKNVNDAYGHPTGDKVLVALAETCRKMVRDEDVVARYGGEEFLVYLPGLDAPRAFQVADRLRQAIGNVEVASDDGRAVRFTVSIGVSSSAVTGELGELVRTADAALYRAKQNGRNRCEVFMPGDGVEIKG